MIWTWPSTAETCRHRLTNKIRSYDSCVLTDPPTLICIKTQRGLETCSSKSSYTSRKFRQNGWHPVPNHKEWNRVVYGQEIHMVKWEGRQSQINSHRNFWYSKTYANTASFRSVFLEKPLSWTLYFLTWHEESLQVHVRTSHTA